MHLWLVGDAPAGHYLVVSLNKVHRHLLLSPPLHACSARCYACLFSIPAAALLITNIGFQFQGLMITIVRHCAGGAEDCGRTGCSQGEDGDD